MGVYHVVKATRVFHLKNLRISSGRITQNIFLSFSHSSGVKHLWVPHILQAEHNHIATAATAIRKAIKRSWGRVGIVVISKIVDYLCASVFQSRGASDIR